MDSYHLPESTNVDVNSAKHGACSILSISIDFPYCSAAGGDFFTTNLYVHLPLYSIFSRVINDCFSNDPTCLELSLLSRQNIFEISV